VRPNGGSSGNDSVAGADGQSHRPLDLRLLVPSLIAWAAGAVTLSWPAYGRLCLATGAAALGLGVWLLGRARGGSSRWRVSVVLSLGALAIADLASGAQSLVREAGPIGLLARQHAAVSIVGVVTSDPVVMQQSGRDSSTVLVRVTVKRVVGRGQVSQVSTPVMVRGDESWRAVAWHSRVSATGLLRPSAAGEEEAALLRPISPPTEVARPGVVARAAEHTRAGLRRAVQGLPSDARGLLPALVIGDTSQTPQDLTDAMLATGMTHLSAVSGSNVAVTLAMALGAARLLGIRRWARPPLALAVLAGFVVLARPEPSVIRAAAMGAIALLGMSRSRRAAGLPVLAAAILALLVLDPWLSRSYGFALSTLATLGLLVFVRPWGHAIGQRLPRPISGWGQALAIPLAAQAMCAPVVVLLQGSVSVVCVLANLLAAPLVAPATVAGVATALAALVWPAAASGVAWIGAMPTLGIARVARVFAVVPGGTAPWPDGPTGALLLAGLTVLAMLSGRWLAHQAVRRPVVSLSVALFCVAGAAPTAAVLWPPRGWLMVVCDVGQGDAVALATTPGHAVLVDTGPQPALVDGCLRRLGVTALDAIVLTHYHADHVEGLSGAGHGRSVREVFATPVGEPAYQHDEVVHWTRAAGIPLRSLVAGDRLVFDQLQADVWWPAQRIDEGSVPNNASVVLAARDGPLDVLLMGDVEREAAHQILLALRRDPRMAAEAAGFDAVKTAHHGSANLDAGLMWEVRAPLALISVGADNDYGHPAPKHLATLRQDGYAVYRTDQRGDIALVAGRDGRISVTWSRR
jgi:competence protein ComEC